MTKLCPRGKAAAKRKFKVYPSAYANAYASKICAGKIKDPSGTKRKDWGPKKAKKGALMIIIGVGKKKKVDKKMGGGMPTAGGMSAMGRLQKARMMNEGGVSKLEALAQRNKALEISSKTKKILGSKGEKSLKKARSEMQVQEGRKKARKVIGKLKNFKNQSKGFLKEMTGFQKGGESTGKLKPGAQKKEDARKKAKGMLLGDSYGNRAKMDYTPNERFSVGGEVRGAGAAIRGKNFKGIF